MLHTYVMYESIYLFSSIRTFADRGVSSIHHFK